MRFFICSLVGMAGCGNSGGFKSNDGGSGEGEAEAEAEGEPGEGESEAGGVAAVDVALDATPLNSSGVTNDDDGDLVLNVGGAASVQPFIWISNSPEGTVSKIDTATGVEVGRYRSGPGSPDPSRTTVGLDGDVVVANRSGSSAARIHADTASCPDTNGNGAIDTSTGPADVLEWGSDECVLWFHDFGGGDLARAAAFDFVADADGSLSSSVWIGLYNSQKLVRLDADTGATITEVSIAGHCPYGMAFDGSGNIWAFSACSASLVHLDTATLAVSTVPLPGGGCAYGIAVDSDGKPWVSGGACVGRYDPATATWSTATVGSSNRGLAHDGAGSVWVADTSFGVHRLDATTMATLADIPLGGGGRGLVGMAVDFDGYPWAVNQGESQAHRIDPVTLAVSTTPTGANPYTYSDMTGFQLVNAAPPVGTFRAIVEGCGAETQWFELLWSAETPADTFVRFRARTADTDALLAAEEFVAVAQQPSDLSPADLLGALETAGLGQSFGGLLELEIALGSATAGVTPALASVGVTSSCIGATLE